MEDSVFGVVDEEERGDEEKATNMNSLDDRARNSTRQP